MLKKFNTAELSLKFEYPLSCQSTGINLAENNITANHSTASKISCRWRRAKIPPNRPQTIIAENRQYQPIFTIAASPKTIIYIRHSGHTHASTKKVIEYTW